MPLRDFTKEEIENICKNSVSFSEMCRKLNYNSTGAISYTIKEYLIKNCIDFSHFTGRSKISVARSPENVFIENSTASQKVTRLLYKKCNYTEYKCSICGQEPFWNGKPMTLILDHANGYNKDNRLENLRWVCPNCNIQLDTTNGKNKNHGIKIVHNSFCKSCGVKVYSDSSYCKSCSVKFREENKRKILEKEGIRKPIIREELKEKIRCLSMIEVGKYYNMSDNAIRKWCDKLDLPKRVTDIKKYSDEEWEKL